MSLRCCTGSCGSRWQVAEVFRLVDGVHDNQLQEFVPWFLRAARRYTGYFNGTYKYGSMTVYVQGLPRYAAWIRLALDRTPGRGLGRTLPEMVRLPALPDLEKRMVTRPDAAAAVARNARELERLTRP